ncbi:hypothetical protein L6R52_17020 [Myxococcota bacterium]|nr:hypothetical protein [Myxococcota bacterium]
MHALRSLRSLSFALAACTLLACSSATRVPLSTREGMPATRGDVKITTAKNDNTGIELKVKHLAEPHRITANATTYVVWAEPPGGAQPQNIGALRVGEDLAGHLETVVPFKSFRLFVTPEATSTATSPTGDTIVSAQIDRTAKNAG